MDAALIDGDRWVGRRTDRHEMIKVISAFRNYTKVSDWDIYITFKCDILAVFYE